MGARHGAADGAKLAACGPHPASSCWSTTRCPGRTTPDSRCAPRSRGRFRDRRRVQHGRDGDAPERLVPTTRAETRWTPPLCPRGNAGPGGRNPGTAGAPPTSRRVPALESVASAPGVPRHRGLRGRNCPRNCPRDGERPSRGRGLAIWYPRRESNPRPCVCCSGTSSPVPVHRHHVPLRRPAPPTVGGGHDVAELRGVTKSLNHTFSPVISR